MYMFEHLQRWSILTLTIPRATQS